MSTLPTDIAANDPRFTASDHAAHHNAAHRNVKQSSSLGVVCISWDDNFTSQMQIADLADSLGQKHTFFIRTGVVGQSGYLTESEIIDLHNRGHEIGAHSIDHLNFANIDSATRVQQFEVPKAYLENLIGAEVTSFAYPFGARNIASDQEAYLRYQHAGLVAGGVERTWMFSRYEPTPFVYGRLSWGGSGLGREAVRGVVLQAIKSLKSSANILQIYAHDPINGNPSAAAEPTWEMVQEAMHLIHDLNIPALNVRDVMQGHPRLVRNAGFESGNLDGWALVTINGASGAVVAAASDTGMPGNHVLRLSSTSDTGTAYTQQMVPVRAGRSYRLSARLNRQTTSGVGQVRVRFIFFGADGTNLGGTGFADGALGENGWQRIESTVVVAPAGAVSARIEPLMDQRTGHVDFDHIWFDEISVGNHG